MHFATRALRTLIKYVLIYGKLNALIALQLQEMLQIENIIIRIILYLITT